MNNRALCIAVVILALCGWSGSAVAGQTPAAEGEDIQKPKMEVANTVLDLGDVLEGNELSACFTLRNAGPGILHIQDVKTGCGCTRVNDLREIPAAGKANLCLTINTTGSRGPRIFKAALHTNDPARPIVMLAAKANIAPLLTLTPDRVFLRGKAEKCLSQKIIIETKGSMPLEVHLMPYDLAGKIKATLTTVVKGKTYHLLVESPPTERSFRGRLILKTNYPGREKIAVPIFRHVPSHVDEPGQ